MTLLNVKGKLPFEFFKLTHAFIHVFFHFFLCISSLFPVSSLSFVLLFLLLFLPFFITLLELSIHNQDYHHSYQGSNDLNNR